MPKLDDLRGKIGEYTANNGGEVCIIYVRDKKKLLQTRLPVIRLWSSQFPLTGDRMTNQRKHVTQMTQAERQAVTAFVRSRSNWSGLDNPHIRERKSKRSVTDADILSAIRLGNIIEAHANNYPAIRFVTRYQLGKRCICVCAAMHGDIVTVWVNNPGDNHKTLNRSEYQWRVNLTSVFNTRGA